ncbi:transposase [Geminicoccus flavidas]
MSRPRLNEQQIIGTLKLHQAGTSAADLCRKYGISELRFYNWCSKYSSS